MPVAFPFIDACLRSTASEVVFVVQDGNHSLKKDRARHDTRSIARPTTGSRNAEIISVFYCTVTPCLYFTSVSRMLLVTLRATFRYPSHPPVLNCWYTLGTVFRSRIRVRCNGWRTNDILKIFVRPPSGGGGCMKCCDLTIGVVQGAPLPSTSPSSFSTPSARYGLLWADPEDVDGVFESKGGWREGDVSR